MLFCSVTESLLPEYHKQKRGDSPCFRYVLILNFLIIRIVGNVFNELLITIRKNQKGLNIVEYMVVLVIRIVSPCGMNLSRGADDLVYSSEGC